MLVITPQLSRILTGGREGEATALPWWESSLGSEGVSSFSSKTSPTLEGSFKRDTKNAQ